MAAQRRHLARQQHRPQSGHLVIGMVGMPVTADISLPFWLLDHLGNGRVAVNMGKDPICVYCTRALGQAQWA